MAFKLILTACVFALARAQSVPSLVVPETGVSAFPFDLSQVSLSNSRWEDNQNRTLNYLKFVDVERLLYNFRATHKLSTKGAKANGGWDAPNFPFRSHAQGHYLTGWAHCYAVLRDPTCRDRATYFVAELAKCQANNAAAGFGAGYLSGFPESEFAALEAGKLSNGNVPYYALHKTMAGLLDVWRIMGDNKAKEVLLALAGWVDGRTAKLSSSDMQRMLGTEFGGMNDVLANVYQLTGDKRWLVLAQRFDHTAVFDPLASNQDRLNGLHANTQVPKWIGAAREYKATGNKRYLDIARNAWSMTVNAHTYAIGGNSQAEHFRPPNAISQYLKTDTAEQCNTYNMLKLTRDLWAVDPDRTEYFDFYERALLNHLLGAQNPADNHGHITYFTPLNPGGRRGVGPAWGGGTWSTDYDSFWCCQGTALETNTKLMDSIYWHKDSTLYVNLFISSVLNWTQRNVTIAQSTTYPVSGTTSLRVTGNGEFTMRIRIPAWTTGASISVNGQKVSIEVKPGSYATLQRAWKSGDTVTIQLPMTLKTVAANDDPSVAAVAYGPVILSGNYGSTSLSSTPTLALDSIRRSGNGGLAFTATAAGKSVNLGPFYEAHGFNYNVYWKVSGRLPAVI
ncbi:DUF1680-domain-containing protein [Westerdykella ornata]|uniref:DUF1680-domain-containing protein n=1 Tax=Westerdykella ornata TaxID=318751 RepID=A0A6A6JYA9_WESOR|nr:DUF1680-domain-containing protein [Westerdykella ornata]KAF2281387.1 DUF1680-domain-containing protein [Westerdykella ornata]